MPREWPVEKGSNEVDRNSNNFMTTKSGDSINKEANWQSVAHFRDSPMPGQAIKLDWSNGGEVLEEEEEEEEEWVSRKMMDERH